MCFRVHHSFIDASISIFYLLPPATRQVWPWKQINEVKFYVFRLGVIISFVNHVSLIIEKQ